MEIDEGATIRAKKVTNNIWYVQKIYYKADETGVARKIVDSENMSDRLFQDMKHCWRKRGTEVIIEDR